MNPWMLRLFIIFLLSNIFLTVQCLATEKKSWGEVAKAFAEKKFSDAYGQLPWEDTAKLESDYGKSILDFIDELAHLTKENRLNEAVWLISQLQSFVKSKVWLIPFSFREILEVDAAKLTNSYFEDSRYISKLSSLEVAAFSYLHYAIWPELKIRITPDSPAIWLYETGAREFQNLKIFFILMVAEELAHAAQHAYPAASFSFVSLSEYMKIQNRKSIVGVKHWRFSEFADNSMRLNIWAEEDVYAFLIEKFGKSVLPLSLAMNYREVRRPVLDYYYPEHRGASISDCGKILTAQ